MSTYLIFGIGLLAQGMFAARLLIQWIASERAHQILSPKLFWQLSMIGSFLFCIYGWLRHDFAILLGQSISYYIYIWNLNAKNAWKTLHFVLRFLFLALPLAALVYFCLHGQETFNRLFEQTDIPLWLIVFGVIGQFTFTLRFIYQWWYSKRANESVLPITFWGISLTGSLLIIAYGVLRLDPILILGQGSGFVVYLRNIMIGRKAQKQGKKA